MGKVVGAAILAHVPTIMLPQDVRFDLNEGKEITLVPGLKRQRRGAVGPEPGPGADPEHQRGLV